jgi:hypothetical protein
MTSRTSRARREEDRRTSGRAMARARAAWENLVTIVSKVSSLIPKCVCFFRLVDFHGTWYEGNECHSRGPLYNNFYSRSFNNFKIIEVQFCEVSLAEQWIWIVYIRGNHGNQVVYCKLM